MHQRIGSPAVPPPEEPEPGGRPVTGMPHVEARQRQEVIEWARTGRDDRPLTATSTLGGSSGVPTFKPYPSAAGPLPAARPVDSPSDAGPAPWDEPRPAESDGENGGEKLAEDDRENLDESLGDVVAAQADSPSVCYLGFQVHNRYLVTQDEAGMVVIDQHALHERVLYERVCARVLADESPLESQRLLVPEPVSLTPAERTATLEAAETLAKIGIEVEDFGGETILVHSYPAMLANMSPSEMLRMLLESVMTAGREPDPKDVLYRLLSTIACKAAVKAGRSADARGDHESPGAEGPVSRHAPLSSRAAHGALLQP